MEEIKIYNSADKLLLSTFVDDESYRLREIMGANNLELRFSLDRFVNIVEGSYCEFKAERYWMPISQNYVKEHSEKFTYSLNLEGSINFLKSTKFKFFDYVLYNGTVKPISSFKLKFPITATPEMIVDLLVANLKLKYPEFSWIRGECLESEPVTLDFNHDSCFDVLAKLADAFNTEWELDKYTFHIGKVEKMKDSAIDLSYGYDNGILSGVERLQLDSKRIVNRVYVVGGDRNIDRSTYGNDTLLLPKNKRITHEGIEYKTDATGSYVERVVPLAGEEDSLDIAKFYPKLKDIGTVTDVKKINDDEGLYNIIDANIPADLDYSKHIIEGQTMTLVFQTGQLAGKEFNVKYIHKGHSFELVPINENGLIYPKGNLIPEKGDEYIVFQINMPEKYVHMAEEEALKETVKYLWENEQSQYSYRWQLDGNYAKRNWGEIRGHLNCGFFVKFSDPQFLPEPVDVRIVAVKEQVNDDKRPEITIANNISSKSFGSIINKIPTQEQATERKDQETVSYVKRGFKQAQETMQMLIDSELEGFDAPLSPIALQSMMLLVGSPQLQFFYVDNKINPNRVNSGIKFEKESKRLVCPLGFTQHRTLGIDGNELTHHSPDKYKYWEAKAYQSDELADSEKVYYLYLRCSKSDYTDGRYILSEKSIAIDELSNYYHLLVGILNQEDDEGNRSWVELFGMTEILPSRINTDKIVSSDGQNFLDFVSNAFKLANLDYNISQPNTLTLEGLLNCLEAEIAGFKFNNDKIESIKQTEGVPNILLDGLNGLAAITGKFESNKDGDRIVIDPEARSLNFLRANDTKYLSLGFMNRDGSYKVRLTLGEMLGSQALGKLVDITDNEILLLDTPKMSGYQKSTSLKSAEMIISNITRGPITPRYEALFSVVASGEGKLGIHAWGLPTNPNLLDVGDIWVDGDVLKIVR